jgi:hypothetical protein
MGQGEVNDISSVGSPAAEPVLAEYVDGLPNLSGEEALIAATIERGAARPVFAAPGFEDPFAGIESAFAIALLMHQPLIPAGGEDPRTAALISNLRYMIEHPDIGDNHNAPVFRWCYKRMAEFIAQLVHEGAQPRVMLEYSGTLLHGLREMGAHDVLDALRMITLEPRYHGAVEWLGCPWGHAVAPSTPVQDYRLSSRGDTASIVALVKTQGSDTKLVAQMQPYYEARGLGRCQLAGRSVPPLVTQIADGENGGVMINEFPPKYLEVMRECSASPTPILNATEYLERLFAAGVSESDLPIAQPLFQHRIWSG